MEKLREELKDKAPHMCGDCQRRAETNPLRVLDCKVEADQPVIDALPSILDSLCEPCRAHFDAVKQFLDDRGIEYEVRPRMVRGLDYYMRTTFEVVHGSPGRAELGAGRRPVRRAGRIAGLERFTRRASDSRSAKTAW